MPQNAEGGKQHCGGYAYYGDDLFFLAGDSCLPVPGRHLFCFVLLTQERIWPVLLLLLMMVPFVRADKFPKNSGAPSILRLAHNAAQDGGGEKILRGRQNIVNKVNSCRFDGI